MPRHHCFRGVIHMRKIFVFAFIAASLVFATSQIAGAADTQFILIPPQTLIAWQVMFFARSEHRNSAM